MTSSTDTQQLNDLLNGQSSGGLSAPTLQLPAGLMTFIVVSTIILTILSFVVIGFWIASMVRRRKVQDAILDIQKQVAEMNERQRAQLVPVVAPEQADSDAAES